ncbi:hypothetical protein [Mycobacterium sp.]|uniref:hypothetical protein n=1 Tax=Mycobacterium sp. TaxID=1785 RepID=UPI002BD49458|nr:hypothetical protein [Mycobacterium sp.]HKP43975.1 hypothetical protein [Mycobacterium sp.]
MTTPSNPLAGVWGIPRDHALGSRAARRISRRCAGVGVPIAPARLQQIAAGAPCAESELTDLKFALTATEIQREERLTNFERRRRRGIQWLIVAGVVLVLLNLLICMAFVVLSMAQHY